MKTQVTNNIVKALLLSSALGLSACDGGSKGGSAATVAVPGVTQTSITDFTNPSIRCDIRQNTYECVEFNSSTGAISFSSLQQFCSLISNDTTNGGRARQVRAQIYAQQCQNVNLGNGQCPGGLLPVNGVCQNGGQIITQPILQPINGPQAGYKNLKCSLVVKKENAMTVAGAESFDVIVAENGTPQPLISLMEAYSEKKVWIFNGYKYKRFDSSRLAKIEVSYNSAKTAQDSDLLTLKVKTNDGLISSMASGYAGSETRLEILPQEGSEDLDLQVSVSCVASQAKLSTTPKTKYACKGLEKVAGKTTEINYSSALTEAISNQTYRTSDQSQLTLEGSVTQGSALFMQKSKLAHEQTVTTKSLIGAASKIQVERAGYGLKISCEPVQ